ncbi:PAAR domain-containing protein [Collimonas humicola]|uniref:PAAR domain-containing protein n=1 Tax=Collimonas humicola TaxID=2825886 RepID=UPI002E784114|nr:PAAR domain-containing protein [Collimonas humicola]
MSGVGHMTHCPKCKGMFPIIEGAPTFTIFGRPTAVEGMKTACGASLIATQHIDTIDIGPGGSSGTSASSSNGATAATVATANDLSKIFDDKFVLRDSDGQPLAEVAYAIERATGELEHGETDGNGHTHLLSSVVSAENINVYLAG